MKDETNDPDDSGDSGISRREVLITLGVPGASVACGAAGWGFLEGVVALRQPVASCEPDRVAAAAKELLGKT